MKHLDITTVNAGRKKSASLSFALLMLCLLVAGYPSFSQKAKKKTLPAREYIQLKVYHAADASQLEAIDQYLQASLLPSLTKSGFKKIGVFKAADNDTARDKRMYVLIPFKAITQLEQLVALTDKSFSDSVNAYAYTKALHSKPVFTRMESILLRAFAGMPQVKASGTHGRPEEKVYELRSYESATEAQHLNKVQMFNDGEVELFDKLGFNAVFYGQVIAGSRMPNLMYITSFENKAARDEHWKTFGGHPEWKVMSSLPQYQNNVSKIDITFLKPTAYSSL